MTKTLIAINVGIYLLQLAQGAPITANAGSIYENGALFWAIARRQLVGLGEGDWYRLITAAFLHYGPIHLAMNMLALWWIGRPLEDYLGPLRYLLLYLVSGLAGSAGALIVEPGGVHRRRVRRDLRDPRRRDRARAPADLRARRQRDHAARRQPRLHLRRPRDLDRRPPRRPRRRRAVHPRLSRFGKGNAAYSRIDVVSIASLVAVGLLSVAVAYWKVKGYA